MSKNKLLNYVLIAGYLITLPFLAYELILKAPAKCVCEEQVSPNQTTTPTVVISETTVTPAKEAPLPSSIMLSIPLYKQKYTASCEIAATKAVLQYYEVYTDEDAILSEIGVDTTSRSVNEKGEILWGNPQKQYVGDYNTAQVYYGGYGVYNQPIEKYLDNHGFSDSVSATNWDSEELLSYIKKGYPIIAWISNDFSKQQVYTLVSPDGATNPFIYREHAIVVRGIDESNVYYMDPGLGQNRSVSISAFITGFSNLDNMAIVVIPDGHVKK